MDSATAKKALAKHRREMTAATKEQVDAWLGDGYPYGVDTGATAVWNFAFSEAAKYGLDPSVAADMAEAYREGSEIFGKPCVPERFVYAQLRRLAPLPSIAAIKRILGAETQDEGREGRLRSLIERYAALAGPNYGMDPKEAASKAGRYLICVLLPHSRNFQNNLRQTPSNPP
ncbi:MAG: hypothetical protein HYT72_02305 [Candidatus Aenigmarchaeota archaeon]|nr:hypothetical protein [Candidatus Aenigmarchaeota archaeon]